MCTGKKKNENNVSRLEESRDYAYKRERKPLEIERKWRSFSHPSPRAPVSSANGHRGVTTVSAWPPPPSRRLQTPRRHVYDRRLCSQVFEAWRWLLENVTGIFQLLDIYRATPRLPTPLNLLWTGLRWSWNINDASIDDPDRARPSNTRRSNVANFYRLYLDSLSIWSEIGLKTVVDMYVTILYAAFVTCPPLSISFLDISSIFFTSSFQICYKFLKQWKDDCCVNLFREDGSLLPPRKAFYRLCLSSFSSSLFLGIFHTFTIFFFLSNKLSIWNNFVQKER